MRQAQTAQKTVRTTLTITMIIALSKIVGFLREIVIAYYFGNGIEASANGTAYQILTIFVLLFSTAAASTFIPQYTRALLQHGEVQANRFVSNVLTLYILLGIAVSIGGYYAAPYLAPLLWKNQEGLELVVELTRLMFPFLTFFAISGVLSNTLNAREKFIPEQLMGFALSFCSILSCILFPGDIRAVSLATGGSALVQVLILLPFCRGNIRYRPRLNFRDEHLRQTFLLALPALIAIAFDEINHSFDTRIASSLNAQAVSSVRYSFRLVSTALGVLVVPLTTIMFSRMSRFAARGNKQGIIRGVKQSSELLGLITLPIIVICVLMSREIIGIVYQRGAFDAAATAYTASAFTFYIIGLFTFGLRNFQTRVFYSIQDTRTPMLIGICSVILNVVLNYTFAITLKMDISGVTLATSVSGAFGALLQLIFLRRRLGPMRLRSTLGQFLRIGLASACCGGAVWLLKGVLPEGGTFALNLLRLIACAGAGFLVYFAAVFLMRVNSVKSCFRMLDRRH